MDPVRHPPPHRQELQTALRTVADYCGVALARLADVLDGYAALSHGAAWRRRQQMLHVPEQFHDLLQAVIAFADPALTGHTINHTWNPIDRRWEPPAGA